MNFIFSKHALEQIKSRNISIRIVEYILANPENILLQSDKLIYQATILEDHKKYLIRIFVNHLKDPAVIITAYKTSKIYKYL